MASYYVSWDTGNDGNAGTSAGSPFKTVDKGLSVLATSDTLYIAASTTAYTWTNRTIPAGVSIIGSVKPNPVNGSYVKISAAGASVYWYFLGSYTLQNLWLDNVINTASSGIIYLNRSATGVIVANYTDCIISNLAGASSTGGRGGILNGGTSVGAYTATSITFNITNCLFKNIESYNSASAGCLFVQNSGTAFTFNLNGCTWYQGTPTLTALDAIVGDYSADLSTVNINNMALVNDSGTNLAIHGAYNAASMIAWFDFTMQGSTYTNITTTNGTITNSTNADAQFIDPASNDFRLKPTSPAIDRGIVI